MKRLIWIITTVFIITLLATSGCGSRGTDNTDVPNTGENLQQSSQAQELLVYSGAGLRKPIEEIASMFQEETGTIIQFSYGGSAQCVGQILTAKKGDVFLPGDVAELKELIEKDMLDQQKPVVLHIPVLAVPVGNPAGITGIKDLAKPGIKVVLGDPEANPIGKLADQTLKDYGIYEQVESNVVARAATVNELFAYLALQQADVAVIWEDNLVSNDKIELVHTNDFDNYIKSVPVVSLNCSTNQEAANEFVEYVASEKAMAVWEKYGFKPAPEANSK